MKIFVKNLKGTKFEIDAKLEDKVSDVKKSIETSQGQNVYPAEQQMLIYQGKVLKDDTTLEENNVAENTFIVVMLSKPKVSSSTGPSVPVGPAGMPPLVRVPRPDVSTPPPTLPPAPVTAAPPASPPDTAISVSGDVDAYGQAASNLVSGNNLEQTVQQILDMGGGAWDRDTVIRALRAAYNNPERAIDYLYSGIPEVEAPPPASGSPPTGLGQLAELALANAPGPTQPPAQQPAVPTGPNANPLNLFPEALASALEGAGAGAGGVGSLDALRNNPQFRTLLALIQSNPQILQPMLQELGKQNPQVLQLIQENQAEFLRLVNQTNTDGADPNLLGQLAGAMPTTVQVTPEEQEALQRLEAMGFNREMVLQVFFACNKNEELAANYLLDHMHEFEDQ